MKTHSDIESNAASALEVLLKCSVLKGELEALAAVASPQVADILAYAARILRLVNPAAKDNQRSHDSGVRCAPQR